MTVAINRRVVFAVAFGALCATFCALVAAVGLGAERGFPVGAVLASSCLWLFLKKWTSASTAAVLAALAAGIAVVASWLVFLALFAPSTPFD